MLQYYYLTRRYQINNLARWCQFFGVWGVGRILQNQNSYVIILHNFIRYRWSVQLDLMSMTVWPCVRLPLKKHQRKTLLILHRKISRFLTFLPQNYCEFYGNRNISGPWQTAVEGLIHWERSGGELQWERRGGDRGGKSRFCCGVTSAFQPPLFNLRSLISAP